MRVAHIIIIHKNLAQLARLIKSLQHPQFDIYVHIDAKVSMDEKQFSKDFPDVRLVKPRIECNWGGYTITKAIFNALAQVVSSGQEYGFINLLSGQDYPISPVQHIYDFLKENEGKTFMSYDLSQESEWWIAAAPRYKEYHLTDMSFKGKHFVEKILNKFTPARKFPEYEVL